MKEIPIRHIAKNPTEPDLSESFSIRNIQDLLGGRDMVQGLHRHDFFFILVLKKGRGNHEIDFTSYKISDHSIFFMRPGQVHQLRLKVGSSGYLIQFRNDFYNTPNKVSKQQFQRASNKSLCLVEASMFKRLLTILTYIFQEYTDQKEGYQEIIKSNLGIFFIELVRQRGKASGSSDNVNPYMQERLDEFLQLLEMHISTHKQPSQYADMLHLSLYQLNAITKATLGKTCSALINEAMVMEAKKYLLATSHQVNQIADHLGYEDVSYFIRFFKKYTGYTPEAFRHKFK